ncbi:beta-galactosidase [candidate division KSB1 bacterium]|nr:beta-galactosidase [candidate division KSB1 bacterium]
MRPQKLRFTSPILLLILGVLTINTALSQGIVEDYFDNLTNWNMLLNGGEARIVSDTTAPAGFGDRVLRLRGNQPIAFLKNFVLVDGVMQVLWKDIQPEEEDSDGVLLARAQNPFIDKSDAVPSGKAHYWVEQDYDFGFQLKLHDSRGQDLTVAEINDDSKITGAWNTSGWVWQKLMVKGDSLKAKFWSAESNEPKTWQLAMQNSALPFGLAGLKLWSGYAHIAYFRIESLEPDPDSRYRLYMALPEYTIDNQAPFNPEAYLFSQHPGQTISIEASLKCADDSVLPMKSTTVKPKIRFEKIPLSMDLAQLAEGQYCIYLNATLNDEPIAYTAGEFHLVNSEKMKADLAALKTKLPELSRLIQKAKSADLDASKALVSETVLKNFIPYTFEDIQWEEWERAERNTKYLKKCCDSALRQLNQLLAKPELNILFPKPVVHGLRIEKGAFFRQQQPVFLNGVMGWDEPVEDIPQMADYGFNAVGIEIGPSSTITGPNEEDVAYDRLNEFILPALRSASRHNVSIMLLVSPHYFPKWAYEMYPDVRRCGHGFLQYCIEHPEARRVVERHLRFLISQVKAEPALHSYCLANEPQFIERCETSRKKFLRDLREKHGTITRLNALWGTQYRQFDDIPIPLSSKFPAGHRYDWMIFHRRQVTEFFTWMKQIIQQEDPTRPVHVKFMIDVFESAEGPFGIDREALGELTEITGCDLGIALPAADEYGGDFLKQAMFYDLLRSFQPYKPIYNSEYHIIRDNDPIHYPANYIRTAIWDAALHGQSAQTAWVWSRNNVDHTLRHCLQMRPEATVAFGEIALDINRFAPVLVEFPRAHSGVAIFYSATSKLLSNRYLPALKQAYEAAMFLDAHIRFISEKQILRGDLKNVKLLIVPEADYVPDDVIEKIAAFSRYAGMVYLVGAHNFQFTEYGQPRSEPQAQVRRAKPELQSSTTQYRELSHIFDRLFDLAEIQRPFRVRNSEGENAWGVEARAVEIDSKKYLSVINWLKDSVEVRIAANHSRGQTLSFSGEPVNLFDNRSIDISSNLILEPMAPMLLEIERE